MFANQEGKTKELAIEISLISFIFPIVPRCDDQISNEETTVNATIQWLHPSEGVKIREWVNTPPVE